MTITDETVLDPSIDRRLAVDIDAAEQDKLVAYQDTRGNWTCGRGHLMPQAAPGRSWAGFTIIQSTSDMWFSTDIMNAMRLASKWPEFASCDTQCRKNALTEIAFNMGGKWAQFQPTRDAITAKDWPTVHNHLLASLWAKEVQPHGVFDASGVELPGRATRIAGYFLTGEYP
jgi:GH24 family phage-related lysozyme (muramidase)